MSYAPIILFTYCRPRHTKQAVEALLENSEASESDLIIYSDGPKNEKTVDGVNATREYIKTISGFKSIQIIERPKNFGLANSIIDGVTSVINRYGKAVIVEDDLIVSRYCLKYINEALELYKETPEVISIHGYMYPVEDVLPESFFIKTADCWGWATWKRGWDLFNADSKALLQEIETKKLCRKFDFNDCYPYVDMLKAQINGKVDSWAIRWYASALVNNKLTLYPGRSLVFQNGMDGEGGTHCDENTSYTVEISKTPIQLKKLKAKENKRARRAIANYFVTLLPIRRKEKKRKRLRNFIFIR